MSPPPLSTPMDSSPPKHPSFSRKVAKKVSSLIAKFEALSNSPDRHGTPPRRRTLSSIVTPSGSPGRRSGIRRSIGRRASKILERVAMRGGTEPLPAVPPPKRLLRVGGRRGSRNVSMPTNYPLGRYPSQLRKRRVVSNPEDAASGITLDGPVSLFVSSEQQSYTEDSIVSTSTPPVARVLPSSFFAQLVAEEEPQHHRRSKVRPRVFTDSDDTELLVVEMTEKVDLRPHFRLGGGTENKGGYGSVWRRKITPPKISVRDLVSRFWQEGPPPVQQKHEEDTEKPEEEAETPEMEMPSFASEEYSNIVTSFSNHAGGASSEEGLMLWGDKEGEEVVEESTSSVVHFTEPETGIVTGVNENDENVSISKPYTAAARLDTPPLPSSKKYRKTPPPSGFFHGKRHRYSATPSLCTVDSSNSGQENISQSPFDPLSPTSSSSSGSYYLSTTTSGGGSSERRKTSISISGASGGGITICTGIPAASILTPVPVSAVQTEAIRSLVARSWGVQVF